MEIGQWGNCSKCGGALDMHYVRWCPSCEPPQSEMRKVFDFFKTARYIARQEGYDQREYEHRDWVNEVLGHLEFPSNDSFIELTPGISTFSTTPQESKEYFTGLVNHFDIGDNETILLEISW